MNIMNNKVTFQYVPVDEETQAVMQNFRDKYEALYLEIQGLEMNRGVATALTNLEQSNMWLNKGITGNC